MALAALRTTALAAPRHAALAAPLAAALLALAAPAALAGTLPVPSEEYPTLQSAVDAAAEGDTILVGAGTLTEGASISGKNRFRIRGVPGAVLQSGTIDLDGCDGVTIEGLAFVDLSNTSIAVHAIACTRLALKNLQVEAYDDDQVLLESCSGVRVTGCTVSNGGGNGLRDNASEDVVVEKSAFSGNAGWAVDLSSVGLGGCPRGRVSKNTVSGPAFGIAAGGEDLRIEGNAVTLVAGPGIQVGGTFEAPRALVQRNTVSTTGNQNRAIYMGGTLARVARNTVTGGAGVGLFVEGNGSRIEGNTVIGGGFQGFHLDGDDLRITGNLAQGVGGESFLVRQGQRSRVTRNRALDAGNTAFYLFQPDLVATKNVSEGAYYGFYMGVSPMTLVGNVAEGSRGSDVISNYSESQYVLTRNRFATFLWDFVEPTP